MSSRHHVIASSYLSLIFLALNCPVFCCTVVMCGVLECFERRLQIKCIIIIIIIIIIIFVIVVCVQV